MNELTTDFSILLPALIAGCLVAISHVPLGQQVLSRGIVGSAGDRITVASPVHKQRFDLRTGTCLDADVSVMTWAVRVHDSRVEVAHPC